MLSGPFPPTLFPSFSPLFPLQALFTLPPFSPLHLPLYTPFLDSRKLRFRYPSDLGKICQNLPEIVIFQILTLFFYRLQSPRLKSSLTLEITQKFRLRNWPISSADFPMTPMEGRDRGTFWTFLGEGFRGNIWRPLVLPAPLFYC